MIVKFHKILFLIISISFFQCTNQSVEEVDFNAQIRPVLNQKCLSCHGGVKKNGGLDLRFRGEALKPADSGLAAIVPGKPKESELMNRVKDHDPDNRMPAEGEALSEKEINLLERWIREGAKWETHWSYLPLDVNIQPPSIKSEWAKNEIDFFVLKNQKSQNVSPSEEASKPELLRRVSLDLTGLLPTPKEAEFFLNDDSGDAYERLVDRLLDSPHFGERWAAMWLDLARYADSQGYQKDLLRRDMWRYRDWVIDAFNQDMPFDQFTIEQLAGDLLPNPTDEQLLATAFHRNTMTNDEGGTDDEEFRVAAVIDRLNTTFDVWQGATIGCVQCHSHPYDPYQHEEFYQLYAFFNTTADADRSNDFPIKHLYSPAQKREKQVLLVALEEDRERKDTLTDEYIKKLESYLNIKPGKMPIMEELPPENARITKVFERGNWLMHGQEVQPNTPAFLHKTIRTETPTRLDLAKWLVDEKNPLTARVIVNRFWEQLFEIGIVETVEDFGTQGERPSNQELLDWLALQFMAKHKWKLKPLLKEIVLSATYRQSAKTTSELMDKDPYNRLLARGPRIRLSSEQIRDQALVASGLFNPKIYGPSVMPHQPEGVWNVIRHAIKWETGKNGDQYRRGLYTFWRRVSPYPSMELFDSPSREVCASRRIATNTPLQALVMLNDPVYQEASVAIAERMKSEGGETPKEQIQFGYQLFMLEKPSEKRLQLLMEYYHDALKNYQTNTNEITELRNDNNNSPEWAALVNVATVILNLDEVIMK